MQHFTDFSNAARKSFTRQKQASIQGQGSSYVDKIQTARRGQTTPIESPYYISRNEAMTHPQDNKVLVAAQRKLAPLGQGARNNEYGVKLFRPEGKDVQYKNGRLAVGSVVEGKKKAVSLGASTAEVGGRPMYKKDIGTIHTHPTSTKNSATATLPSIPDLKMDNSKRQNYTVKYDDPSRVNTPFESLILSTPAGKKAKTSVTSYRQMKTIPYEIDNYKNAHLQDVPDMRRQLEGLGGQYNTFTPS